MKSWMNTKFYLPTDRREVLVYDQERKRFDICYYKHEDDIYIDPEMEWKNRNGEEVNARFWRDLPFIPGN